MKNHELKQEILEADSAINRKDFDAVSEFYTQDATLVVRPGLLVSGRSDIREAHKRISEYFNGSLEVSQGEMVIIEAGDTALVMAETIVKSPGKPDSEYPEERNAIYVYVKDDQGKWLCAIDNSYGVELLKKMPNKARQQAYNKDDMNTNYTREIVVSSTPVEAYKALTTGFDKWWTTGCSLVSETGDKITFEFGPSYWVMRASNLVPEKLVELECIEAHHVHDGLPSSILNEWKGSKLKWEIQKQEEKTKIVLVHEGLVPSLECYEVCEQGWDYFFVNSLKQYLDTGEGSPFENEA